MAATSPATEVHGGFGGARLVNTIARVRELGLVLVLIAIALAVWSQRSGFLSTNNIRQILVSVSIVAVVAAGQTLVVLTRNIDLSVGSTVGLTAFVAGDLFRQFDGIPVFAVVLAAVILGGVLGVVNGLLVTVGQVPAIVATLGTLYVYRGIFFAYGGGDRITARDVPAEYRDIAMYRFFGEVPAPIVIATVVTLIGAVALRYTRPGRDLYAIGSNPEAARLVGIPAGRRVFWAFVICGMLAGLGGVIWGARFGTVDTSAAQGFELQVVSAVVVGGVAIFGGSGTIVGAALGAIILGTIQNALTILRLEPLWIQAISGGAILLAVTIDALITRRLQRALLMRRTR